MIILQAILLGIIEGLTEFLPISSTGHLLVSKHLLGYKDTAEIFTVVIQVGAIAAVIWHYRGDLLSKFRGLLKRDKQTLRFWKLWILATIPAGVAGLLVEKKLSTLMSVPVVAIALVAGGVVILLVERYAAPKAAAKKPDFHDLTLKQSIQVGCYQVLSLIPGVSRSGATIMGGLVSGLDRGTATAFSFYLSIPVLVLAGGYKLVSGRDELSTVAGGATALLVGTVVSFFSALLVVNWLLGYVSKHSFTIFAYYRIVLGGLILTALLVR